MFDRPTLIMMLIAVAAACGDDDSVAAVQVAAEGPGSGQVSTTTDGFFLDCRVSEGSTSGTCELAVENPESGQKLDLLAAADEGSVASWEGCDSGGETRCQITLMADETHIATVRFDLPCAACEGTDVEGATTTTCIPDPDPAICSCDTTGGDKVLAMGCRDR